MCTHTNTQHNTHSLSADHTSDALAGFDRERRQTAGFSSNKPAKWKVKCGRGEMPSPQEGKLFSHLAFSIANQKTKEVV
jgi:hypothetical protein